MKQKNKYAVSMWFSMLGTVMSVLLVIGGCANTNPSSSTYTATPYAIQSKKPAQKTVVKQLDNRYAPIMTLSLEEVMARSVKYNLAYRMKHIEDYQARQIEDMAAQNRAVGEPKMAGSQFRAPSDSLKKLSKIGLSGGYMPVTEEDGNSYQSHSVGSTADHLAAVWNLLDSGVNKYNLQRLSGDGQVLYELRRKIIQNLMQEARTSYWKAVAAQQSMAEVGLILEMANESMEKAKAIEKKGKRFPTEILKYQITMLDVIRKLEQLRSELQMAQTELTTLIKHDTTIPLKLLDSSQEQGVDAKLPLSLRQFEQLALMLRPELQTEQATNSVNIDDTRKAIVRVMSDLHLSFPERVEDNPALGNKKWESAGIRLAGNLFNLGEISWKQNLVNIGAGQKVTVPLAVSMAIVAQTNIAYFEYLSAKIAREKHLGYYKKSLPIKSYVSSQGIQWAFDHLAYVRKTSKEVLDRVQHYENHARFQNSVGRLQSSIGFDLLPYRKIKNRSIGTMTRKMKLNHSRWHSEVQTLAVFTALNSPTVQYDSRNAGATEDRERKWEKEAASPLVFIPPEELLDFIDLAVEESAKNLGSSTAQSLQKVKNQEQSSPAVNGVKTLKPGLQPVARMVDERVKNSAAAKPGSDKVKVHQKNLYALKSWRYAVQVAAVYDKSVAAELVDNLSGKGYSPLIWESTDKKGKKFQRVWIGFYSSFKQAKKVQEFYSKQESRPAFIVPKSQLTGNKESEFEQPAFGGQINKPEKSVPTDNPVKSDKPRSELKPEIKRKKARAVRVEATPKKGVINHKTDPLILDSWHYAVQIAALNESSATDELVERLSRKGYLPIIWESEDNNGKKFQRILLGVYENIKQARKAQEYYGKHENKAAFILPESQLVGDNPVDVAPR
jgi:cell division septation protein DedD